MTVYAPAIWIVLPILVGIALLFVRNARALSVLGGSLAMILALAAQFVPIAAALRVGNLSLKIDSSLNVLGRVLTIDPAEGSLLAIIYGGAALWFFGSVAAGGAARIVPMGFMILGLLVASIAVQPFLYAALFIEMAILISVPMLTSIYSPPSKGILRFLIYQTLAMPFILLAGWLLAGVEASPGDIALAAQSASMLGLGLAFLLAIFPLYNWIPMLMEDSHPFTVGFLIWILPTITIFFAAGFLDGYSWIRSSPQMILALRSAGLLMIVTGGLWAAFQRHLGRIMAFGSITETGFSLLALSLDSRVGIPILFLLIPARTLTLALWSLGLTVMRDNAETMQFGATRGMLRATPFAGAAILLASLSASAFPLLAGFPPRLALWEDLSSVSTSAAVWMGIGIAGLLTSAVRSLAVLGMAEEFTSWKPREDLAQRVLLTLGMIGLFILGLFPQTAQFFLSKLPLMFENLGR
jgi:formate hydrogenlyase subunit 3/multisubunit Na+/H+ antiporter MnhD subunit